MRPNSLGAPVISTTLPALSSGLSATSHVGHGDAYVRTCDPPQEIVAVRRLKAFEVFQVHTGWTLLEVDDQAVTGSIHSGDGDHAGRRFAVDPAPEERVAVQAQKNHRRRSLRER
jgi:hypothetical protein